MARTGLQDGGEMAGLQDGGEMAGLQDERRGWSTGWVTRTGLRDVRRELVCRMIWIRLVYSMGGEECLQDG